MTVAQKTKVKASHPTTIPSKWEGVDIDQELFKAFERGEAHQRNKDKQEVIDIFNKNINKAATLSESIFHTSLKDYSVKINKAFLKVDSIESFETLFLVDRKDYLSDKLKEVYKKSFAVKSDFNCDEFRISFKFMPTSENINVDCIHADGFNMEYGEKH